MKDGFRLFDAHTHIGEDNRRQQNQIMQDGKYRRKSLCVVVNRVSGLNR
jgi:hypothetical protein